MKVLVTGGAGFIGSHLVERLVKDGHEVRVIDRVVEPRNLIGVRSEIDYVNADIVTNMQPSVMEGIEVVFHLAANCSVSDSINNPVSTHYNNVTGTFEILNLAKASGVKQVVFSSSSAVYGDNDYGFEQEVNSYYGMSKKIGELTSKQFKEDHGLNTVSLRYFNVYGPRQNPQYSAVIPSFIQSFMNGKIPKIHGDGEQTRSFIHVSDVVEANIRAMDYNSTLSFDIGTDEKTTIKELYYNIASIFGVKEPPVYVERREGDIYHSTPDTSGAKTLIDFKSKVTLEEGLPNMAVKPLALEMGI